MQFENWTSLMIACREGDDRRVRALIKANVDLQATQNQGLTALMISCNTGNEQSALALIQAGAKVRRA